MKKIKVPAAQEVIDDLKAGDMVELAEMPYFRSWQNGSGKGLCPNWV